MPGEPACRRGGQRCVEAAGRHTDDHAEQDLELTDRAGLARRDETEAKQRAAREHDRSRSEPVGERSPEERGRAHAQEIEQRRGRDARPGPAGRRRHRLQEDAERHHRAHPEAGYDDAGADDDPAVEDLHGARPSRPPARSARSQRHNRRCRTGRGGAPNRSGCGWAGLVAALGHQIENIVACRASDRRLVA